MQEYLSRTELMFGKEAIEKLASSHVAVFGVGGVGGYVVEALVRSGVGEITVVDNDTVAPSNFNRQIIADVTTVGKYKVDAIKERAERINPSIKINAQKAFFLPPSSGTFSFDKFDYVVDAVDTVAAKIELAVVCKEKNVPLICCLGTGNKADPTLFEISDLYKTSVCPLARVMRRGLKKRGIDKLKVLYSKEEPIAKICDDGDGRTPASNSFTPPVAGFIIAGEVIKNLIGFNN